MNERGKQIANFNSYMVRLKDHELNQFFGFKDKFQFLYGTIKRRKTY